MQAGPILVDTDKTEEQIQDRCYEIYELFMDGARKHLESPAHKIGTMISLSSDDMSLLMNNQFMSLTEFIEIYLQDVEIDR